MVLRKVFFSGLLLTAVSSTAEVRLYATAAAYDNRKYTRPFAAGIALLTSGNCVKDLLIGVCNKPAEVSTTNSTTESTAD